jgi:hypothetical protein
MSFLAKHTGGHGSLLAHANGGLGDQVEDAAQFLVI